MALHSNFGASFFRNLMVQNKADIEPKIWRIKNNEVINGEEISLRASKRDWWANICNSLETAVMLGSSFCDDLSMLIACLI